MSQAQACSRVFFFLESPEALDEEGGVAGETQHGGQGAVVADGAADAEGLLAVHAELGVEDAEGEEGAEGTGEDLAVAAVELDDGGEGKGQRDVLSEVLVGPGRDEELAVGQLLAPGAPGGGAPARRRGGGGGAALGAAVRTVAQRLLALEAVADDAGAQEGEVGRERNSEAAGDWQERHQHRVVQAEFERHDVMKIFWSRYGYKLEPYTVSVKGCFVYGGRLLYRTRGES